MKDQPENWPKNVVLGSDLREAATVWAVVTRLCTKPGTELSTLFVQAIAHSWSGWLDGKTVEEMENEVLDRLPGLVEKGLISAEMSHYYSTRFPRLTSSSRVPKTPKTDNPDLVNDGSTDIKDPTDMADSGQKRGSSDHVQGELAHKQTKTHKSPDQRLPTYQIEFNGMKRIQENKKKVKVLEDEIEKLKGRNCDMRRRLRALQAYLSHPAMEEVMASGIMLRLFNDETEFTEREMNEVMEIVENEILRGHGNGDISNEDS